MLIEVKVKVTRTIDNKKRKAIETYIINKEVFAEAEYAVSIILNGPDTDEFEIQSLKLSPIKEICSQYTGEHSFIATLKDIYHDDEGNEKSIKYKVLLWADSLSQATSNALELQRQGYEMSIESLKQVDYEYITDEHQTVNP